MASPRLRRWLTIAALIVLVTVGATSGWLWWSLNNSLPQLQGERLVSGLDNDVSIERDAQGIPTLRGESRDDIAFALGFLHAQERFFQMDLLRRNSAGELSALFGTAALEHDRRIRVHQFRRRAQRALDAANDRQIKLLDAYNAGVNSGLESLGQVPFEYLLLRTEPTPWQSTDTLLVLYSMYLDLQPEWNEHERSLAVLRELLPSDWYAFLTPAGGHWDAPIHGEAYTFDVDFPEQPLADLQYSEDENESNTTAWHYRDGVEVGSNNWSVAGRLSETGAGLVANDMHLGLSVPNIWYRASWYLPGDGRRVTGVTLPGTPTLVVGSNESIAWGFTNAYGDFHDSIILQTNADNSEYLTDAGWREFDIQTETISVKGDEPVEIDVRLTQWGPVIGTDHNGNLLALRWVAHDAEGANLNSLQLETANTVHRALDIAATAGIPGQNFNVVDRSGNQGWTIMGRLPRRNGFDSAGVSPRLPADWAANDLNWQGYLSAHEYPRIVNPVDGRLWTANARVVSDELLGKVGLSDHALGARQQQIKDNLFARPMFTERDFLDIALDDRALFLQRWHDLLLSVADSEPSLQRLRAPLRQWLARAGTDAVGYRIVWHFRGRVLNHTVGELLQGVEHKLEQRTDTADKTKQNDDDQNENETAARAFWPWRVDNMVEYPVWALITEQPARHVPQGYESWPDFLTQMARDTLQELTENNEALADQPWGEMNRLNMRHPLSTALPFLSSWLDMPALPMPGDSYMPRVQTPNFGASERMVVSPGHEQRGILHMPGGQSGHPLSPYYDRGHDDWVYGRPSGFLPGPMQWQLQLKATE